jgi:hypothetical protein
LPQDAGQVRAVVRAETGCVSQRQARATRQMRVMITKIFIEYYSLSICGVRDVALIVAGRVCVLVAHEVTHRKSEIHSRVDKFAQNLHVGDLAVEAEKKSLNPRFKHARFLAFRRPTRKALYVIQRAFVLQ